MYLLFYKLYLYSYFFFFFFFNDTATTEIYTLSLHDALPIFCFELAKQLKRAPRQIAQEIANGLGRIDGIAKVAVAGDRKSTRLKSSHLVISYAVFCLKKKNKKTENICSHIH